MIFTLSIATVLLSTSVVHNAWAKSPPDRLVILNSSNETESVIEDADLVKEIWSQMYANTLEKLRYHELNEALDGLSRYGLHFQWSDNSGGAPVMYYFVSGEFPSSAAKTGYLVPSNPINGFRKADEKFNALVFDAYQSVTKNSSQILPSLEKPVASEIEIVNPSGQPMIDIMPGQLVLIQSEISNSQHKKQSFAYIVQIRDEDDITVSLSWIIVELSARQSLIAAQPWIPNAVGDFLIEIFVWDGINNPVVLSPMKRATLTVSL